MSNSLKYYFSDFTRSNYRRLLSLAKNSYSFCDYENFSNHDRIIIMRHDLDFSVHSAYRLAEIEKAEGIITTYFIHLHNKFYNTFEKEITELLSGIFGMGHKAGIHFDTDFYNINEQAVLEEKLVFEKRVLEDLFEVPFNVFSFHNPTEFILNNFVSDTYAGIINAYGNRFRNFTYCSDSNGYWRFNRLEDVINDPSNTRLHVLIHPAWWQDEVLSPKKRIWRCIDGRAEKIKQSYIEELKNHGREIIDD
jgi:hypothetical protein